MFVIKGEVLAETILKMLADVNLPIEHCVGQSYDGASNMSSRCAGTSAVICREKLTY